MPYVNRYMKLSVSIIVSAVALFGLAQAVSAAEVPIFRMADGRYYHPPSGMLRESPERILSELGLIDEGEVPAPASAPAPESDPTPGVVPAANITAPTLKDAVIAARETFQAQVDAWQAAGTVPRRVGTYDTFVDVTLAVWNSETRAIEYVDVKKNGKRLEVLSDVPYEISVIRTNGVNSRFGFDDGGERVVVAVKYPIFRRVPGAEGWYDLVPVVYTPWSKRIHTPEIVSWGKDVLLDMIRDVYGELRAKDIRSLAFPDRQLADVISPELVQAISVIEHVGVNSLTGDNGAYVMDSVFVILATNQDTSYAYSRSSMGAKGMAQFIPSTYRLMVNRRPELGLMPDFEEGLADARNAIKAMVGYLDAELDYMPLAVQDLFYVDESRVHEYLAAAYNAGGVRVRRAILMWGDAWSQHHVAANYTQARAILRDETIKYVAKLRAVKGMLLKPVIDAHLAGEPDGQVAGATSDANAGLTKICFADSCHWIQL